MSQKKLALHFMVGFRHLHRRVGFQDLPHYVQQAHPQISCHLSFYSVIYPQNSSKWKLDEMCWHKCFDTSEDEIFQVLSLLLLCLVQTALTQDGGILPYALSQTFCGTDGVDIAY